MSIIPPGFVEISIPLKNAALTRSAYVVFGCAETEGDPDPVVIAGAVQNIFATTLGAGIDNQVTIGPTRAAIGQDGGDPIVGFATGTAVGGSNIESLPPANAVVYRKNTATGGRRGRGFMYIPWQITRASVSEGGNIEASAVTSRTTAANNFLTALNGANLPMVLLHSPGVSAVPDPTPVTTMVCTPVISHQVRRQTR